MRPTVEWRRAQTRQREYEQLTRLVRHNSPLLPVTAGLPVEGIVAPRALGLGVIGYVRIESPTHVVLASDAVPHGAALDWAEGGLPEWARPHLTLTFLLLAASRTGTERPYALAYREQCPEHGPARPPARCHELRNYAVATLAHVVHVVYQHRGSESIARATGLDARVVVLLQTATESGLTPELLGGLPVHLTFARYARAGNVVEARAT